MSATDSRAPTNPTGTRRLERWLSLILFGCGYVVAYLVDMLAWLVLQMDWGTQTDDVFLSPSPSMAVRVLAVVILALAGIFPAAGMWVAVRSIRGGRSAPSVIGLLLNGLLLLSVVGVVAANLVELTRIASGH